MNAFYNLARVVTATIGTGTLTLGAAVFGHLTFAQAGVSNGAVVSYGINDGANSETGWGVYNSTGPTLTRNVYRSTGAGNNTPISLSGSAQVFIAPLAEDFVGTGSGSLVFDNSPAFTGNPTAPTPPTADNDTSIATTAFVKAQGYVTGGPYLPLTGGTLSGPLALAGINFGSVVASAPTDLSKHIALYAAAYGFSITSASLNYNVGGGAAHHFYVASVDKAWINAAQFYLANRLTIGSAFPGLSGNGLAIAPASISRSYNVYTDAANNELAYNGEWISNVVRYGTDNAGTGISRDVSFVYGGAEQLRLTSAGPTAPTQATGDNSTLIATTAFVKAQGYVGGGPYLPLTGGALSGALTASGSITAGTGSTRALSLIGGTSGTANRPKVAAASGSVGLLLSPNDDGGGAIIRLISESSSVVELSATDATGNLSYQQLKFNGSAYRFNIGGVLRLDFGITTAGIWTFGGIVRLPGGGAGVGLTGAGGVLQFQNLDPTPGNWTRIQFLDSDGDAMAMVGHKNVDHVANGAGFAIGVRLAGEVNPWAKIDFNDGNAAAWTLYTKTAIAGLLALGGGAGAFTASFPALKRSGAGLQVRLADDSGFAMLEADRIGIGIVPPPSVTLAVGIAGLARSYNTYTDAANHEYADLGNWISNIVYYGSGKIGTGLARDVIFTRGGSIYMLFDTNGISLGATLIQRPGPIVNPVGNGDLVVQATSNTQLTFKYKGSDGVVRSASLTLA